MKDQTQAHKSRTKLGTVAKTAGVVTILLIGTGPVAQRMSDGPTGPIPGGLLRTGTLVSEPDVDWSFANGQMIELQLVEPLGSRTTGVMVHEGQLYAIATGRNGRAVGFAGSSGRGPDGWSQRHLVLSHGPAARSDHSFFADLRQVGRAQT